MTIPERLVPSPQGDNTLIVIPTYNEMETLPGILTQIWSHVPRAHILIVDDSSPDGTGEWVDSRCTHEDRLHVLHRPAKSGLATAYVDGMGWASSTNIRSYSRWTPTDRTVQWICRSY